MIFWAVFCLVAAQTQVDPQNLSLSLACFQKSAIVWWYKDKVATLNMAWRGHEIFTVSPRTKSLEICLNASRKFLWYLGSLEIRPHRVSLMLQMTSKVQSGTKKRISHVPFAMLKVHDTDDTVRGGTDGRDRCRGVEGGGFSSATVSYWNLHKNPQTIVKDFVSNQQRSLYYVCESLAEKASLKDTKRNHNVSRTDTPPPLPPRIYLLAVGVYDRGLINRKSKMAVRHIRQHENLFVMVQSPLK